MCVCLCVCPGNLLGKPVTVGEVDRQCKEGAMVGGWALKEDDGVQGRAAGIKAGEDGGPEAKQTGAFNQSHSFSLCERGVHPTVSEISSVQTYRRSNLHVVQPLQMGWKRVW